MGKTAAVLKAAALITAGAAFLGGCPSRPAREAAVAEETIDYEAALAEALAAHPELKCLLCEPSEETAETE